MRDLAQDLVVIQGYINRGQDLDYWTEVRETLRDRFLIISDIKKNIESRMYEFEYNLFYNLRAYMQRELLSYYDYLLDIYDNLPQIDPESQQEDQKYAEYLLKQIKTIESIRYSSSFEEMLNYARDYIYLKKQLAGRYE